MATTTPNPVPKTTEKKGQKFLYKYSKEISRLIALSIAALVFGLLSLLFPSVFNPENKMYYEKASIKATMQKVIKNKGDLTSIKQIYDTRNLSFVSGININKNKDNYYIEDYPLSGLLEDLRIDYFLSEAKDTVYLQALEKLIAENEIKYPFDNLDENQKYHFQNVQEKMDTTYETISPEMNRIADELNNKNQLVTRYLNKSESSFRISILALVISIIIGAFQIIQNILTSKKIKEIAEK